MKLSAIIILTISVMVLCACGTKVTKSSLIVVYENIDIARLINDEADNFWRDCFDSNWDEMQNDMENIFQGCASKELDGKPEFMSMPEVEAVSKGITLCAQIEMWKIHKEEFSLDKNIDDKKKLKFCTKTRDSYKKYGRTSDN